MSAEAVQQIQATTAIPEILDDAKIHSRPNKTDLENRVNDIEKEIESLKEESKRCKLCIEKIQGSRDELKVIIDSTFIYFVDIKLISISNKAILIHLDLIQGEVDTAKAAVNATNAERRDLMNAKTIIVGKRDACQTIINGQLALEKQLRAELNYSSVEEIDKKIRDLERKQATTSMTLNLEKQIMKDIKALQQSKKSVAALKEIKDLIDKEKIQRAIWDKQYTEKMAVIKVVSDRLKEQKTVLEKLTVDTEGTESFPDLKKKVNDLREEMNSKYQIIKEIRLAYKKQEDVYYAQIKAERLKQKEEKEKEYETRRLEEELIKKAR